MKDSGISLGQIDNVPLRERVVSTIRDAILSGKLIPGQVLVETELASQMGVSRAPIREAIQILNTEGLVESVPYHGTTVRALTQTDVEELYSLRSALEELAVRRVIAQDEAENGEHLRRLYGDMVAAAEAGNLEEVSAIDRTFHDALIMLSQHHMLSRVWNVVSLRVRQVMALRRIRRKIQDHDAIKQIVYSHLPIIDAITEADEEKAVHLIREHIATSGDLVAADWDSRGEMNDR